MPSHHRQLDAEYLDFSSNDYLNLQHSEVLQESAYKAIQEYGVGSTGARLLSGNYELATKLEEQVARDKGVQNAIIMNSGYQANLGVIAALLDPTVLGTQAIAFCDRFNHASIYQGIKLTGAELVRYHHNDIEHLQAMLEKYSQDARPKFIFSETLYGMDGDVAPLPTLVALAQNYSAFLYLDEAHATGILGPNGYGLSTTIDLAHIPHLVMGTFSKAIGVFGAYIACTDSLRQYLMNRCAGFIYSTMLPPMVIGAVSCGWQLVSQLDKERAHLLGIAEDLRQKLRKSGVDIGGSSTHIIPIILGDEVRTMKAKEKLLQNKILVSAIRPPTVPPASSRLRIALTLAHQRADVDRLFEAVMQL